MTSVLRIACSMVFLVVGTTQATAKTKTHAFGWEDMFRMVRLSDPQPSPDGNWVLFGTKSYDIAKNKSNANLAMIRFDGTSYRQLTHAASAEYNGRWSIDGRWIYFLSSRSGSSQLWKLPTDGGEASQVTSLKVDIEGFDLLPTGNRIVFWAQVFPDCKDLSCTAKRLAESEASPVKARIFDRLFIRHWDTWFDGRRNHIFMMDLESNQVRDLTPGWDQDTPTKPWGGQDEWSWSPDGTTLAFASKSSKGEAWHTNTDIFMVRLDRGGKPKNITEKNKAWDTGPVFSPDGKMLAYLAMDRPGFEADKYHIELYDIKTGKTSAIAKNFDRSVSQIIWSADGKTLYITAPEHARDKIFAVNLKTEQVTPLVEDGTNKSISRIRTGQLVFLRDRMTHPKEVFAYNPANGKTRQITQVNSSPLAQTSMSQPEEFWFEHDGHKIHGWLLKPVDFRKWRKYPLAFLIHGGPQGNWGDDFHYRWNPQFYAGSGYVTVAIDFRGSSSYGQKFQDANRGNWGVGPYSDLMAGLDHVLKNHKYIDRKRMCALGASYGGYMVNWVAGQDHPFRCLVNHDGDFDTVSSYFNTEELWFPEWEMQGTPWTNKETYEKNSPMRFVHKWKTPMLVIQGAKDFRVVETEAFSTFTALQRLGIESQLLYFPDENHWILKPQNSRLWHQTVLDWLDRWTKTKRR